MGMGWSFDWRRTKVEPEPEELYTERINKSDARQPPPTVETDGIASVTTPISTINFWCTWFWCTDFYVQFLANLVHLFNIEK